MDKEAYRNNREQGKRGQGQPAQTLVAATVPAFHTEEGKKFDGVNRKKRRDLRYSRNG